jgi:competence protein ComEC
MFVAFIKRAPFLRLTISLSAGIFLQLHVPSSLPTVCCTAIFAAGAVSLGGWLTIRLRFQYDWLRGVALQLLIVCIGSCLVYSSDLRHNSYYFDNLVRPGDLLHATVREPLQQRAKSYKTILQVTGIVRDNKRLPAKGKLLVYFAKDSSAAGLLYGDRLLVAAETAPVQRDGNPGAFDYRQYCASQQIYRQTYLKNGNWRLLKQKDIAWGMHWILFSRTYCLHTLQKFIGGTEAGLAAALLIGYRYELDKGMVQAYMNTGIVHIVAISGMHLALIYGGLLWMLRWWPRHRFSEGMKGIMIILLLWAFTFLTGGSPSVLRATVMFTFLTVGRFMLNRYTNVYNTLAASAFLLLCYEPRLLTDAGFQLSYLAVLSIVICYRRLYFLCKVPNKWVDKLWDMTALTLAAQVLTLPVCLYYFHQFPVFFLPANMLAVPLSTVILYGEILLLALGKITFAAALAGAGLRMMMQCMNNIVAWFGGLPGALITNIYMHVGGMLCLYISIAGLLLWWLHGRREGLLLLLTGMMSGTMLSMAVRLREQQQRRMVVYNVPRHTLVDVIAGHLAVQVGSDTVMLNDSLYIRYIQPAHGLYNVRYEPSVGGHRGNEDIKGLSYVSDSSGVPGCRFISVGDKRLVIVDKALPRVHVQKKFRTDYLLLSHNPQVDIRQLEEMFDAGCYIFDASSTLRNIQRWKSDCYVLTLRFFSVPDQGAYVVNF